MNLAFKIMAFSIFLNVAIGIMMTAVIESTGDNKGCPIFGESNNISCYSPERTAGLSSDNDVFTPFFSGMNQTVTPSSTLDAKGDQVYRVLDLMNLGFIERILKTIKQYMYGLVVLLDEIFGSYMEANTQKLIFGEPFGFAYLLMTFTYTMAALSLWTGRNYND